MRRLFAVLLGLVVAAALPLNASADDSLRAAILEAKFMATEGPDAPPDLIGEDETPVIGDADSTAAARAFHGRGQGVKVNDPSVWRSPSFVSSKKITARSLALPHGGETGRC